MTDVVFLIGHIDLWSGRYEQILPGKIPKQTQLGLRHHNSLGLKTSGTQRMAPACLIDHIVYERCAIAFERSKEFS
jgi:hypothetical protein